ncbi:MAG: inner membrane CreD family protein [Vicinamibacteria bacterium]|nr:inner membrane CreD family protein [Vicinamibacteria bacterium]
MSIPRLLAISAIFILATLAWFTLGASIVARTGEFDGRLGQEVAQLWGGEHRQVAPRAWVERPREVTERVSDGGRDGQVLMRTTTRTVVDQGQVPLEQSRVDVDLTLAHRQKGLLWYDTYAVAFRGHYRVRNPDPVERTLGVEFTFPSSTAIYDQFTFRVNQQSADPVSDLSKGLCTKVVLPAGGEALIEVAYDSRGLDTWNYVFAKQGVAEVTDFVLAMTTDFVDVDFPAGTMSPSDKRQQGAGWRLSWRFGSLVTGQHVGMDLPNRLNPGPLAARITAFAPVSLLFFMVVMVILGVLQQRNLHPVNYGFLSAAFFAFHLLLAYLVDHVDIHVAFVAASAVSIGLVVSYLRLVSGTAFALGRAGLAQLIFLVLFSYAFFFEGYTGLTVTLGAIVTLFVLMQMTARVDWANVFTGASGASGSSGPAVRS